MQIYIIIFSLKLDQLDFICIFITLICCRYNYCMIYYIAYFPNDVFLNFPLSIPIRSIYYILYIAIFDHSSRCESAKHQKLIIKYFEITIRQLMRFMCYLVNVLVNIIIIALSPYPRVCIYYTLSSKVANRDGRNRIMHWTWQFMITNCFYRPQLVYINHILWCPLYLFWISYSRELRWSVKPQYKRPGSPTQATATTYNLYVFMRILAVFETL